MRNDWLHLANTGTSQNVNPWQRKSGEARLLRFFERGGSSAGMTWRLLAAADYEECSTKAE